MRPAAIQRLGLHYQQVRSTKPDIIYCNACGFGPNGPYAERPAYDDVIQAASGIPSLFAMARGEPDYMPAALCDKIASLTIVYSVLAALLGRSLGKGGQEIDVAMFESAAAFNLMEHLCGFAFDPPLEKFGWSRVLARNRRPFQTKDGYACILPYSKQNWEAFFGFIGRHELVGDPRFETHPGRIAHIEFLYSIVAETARRHTNAEWLEFCEARNIPFSPVNELADLWEDPHLKAVGLLGYAQHPTEGRYRTIGQPTRFGETPTKFKMHAPRAGQHTDEVLLELGMSKLEIDELIKSGAAQRG
jgi:crotonobetainyl-CoA:carnitine CoA-transferase CaiB-like acyl-CoA transferase